MELRKFGVVKCQSRTIETAALGPSRRRYANAALVLATDMAPPDMLAKLKRVETDFGRRPGGQRWGARVLDCDIILWSAGAWSSRHLTIPHPLFARRSFVLEPAAQVASYWRDPVTGLTVRQLNARLTRPRPLPR